MYETNLHPTSRDTVEQICDQDQYISHFDFRGDRLLVHTVGTDHPEGADKLHQTRFLEYMKTSPQGENFYGQNEFILHYNVNTYYEPDY